MVSLSVFKDLSYFICVSICFSFIFACVYVHCVCVSGAQGGQKRPSEHLELEFQTIINHHVDALRT